MISKKQKIMGVLAACVLAAIPFGVLAQVKDLPEAEPSPIQEEVLNRAQIEFIADDIIDSELFTPQFLNADGKFENLPAKTRIYYADTPTDKTIVSDGDAYSAVEKISETNYRIYAADTFVYADGTWRTIGNRIADPADFDSVMLEMTDPTLGDLLSGVFHAHAQTYSETADGFAGCSWLSNDYPWNDAACDNYDATDHASAQIFSYSSQWDNRTAFLAFDTQAIGGTLDTATLHLFYNDTWDSDVTASPWAVEGQQSATDDLTIDDQWDYPHTGGTQITITADNYAEHEIDVTGFTNVDDWTKVAIVSDDLYSESGSVTNSEMVAWYASEQSGTDYDPYLDIELDEETGTTTPEATTTTEYASSTPGLTTTTAIFFLFFAIVFVLGGLIILSWLRDIFA